MAKMKTADKQTYPRLAEFVPQALHGFHADTHKLDLFLQFSQLTRAKAEKALTKFNTLPWLDIDPIGLGSNGLPALGKYDPDFKQRITLAQDMVERFEMDFQMLEAQEVVEATILHEMVHWGDFFDDAFEAGDPGARFELAAYGKRHKRWYDFVLPSMSGPSLSRFVFPMTGQIGRGTAYWGENIRAGGTRSHHGIDIFNEIGTPVHAIADGMVLGGDRYRVGASRRGEVNNYGQMIDIDHGNGLVSRYAHLDTVEARPGPIKQGQRIGTMGASGTVWGRWLHEGRPTPEPPDTATAPHLHFEIRKADGRPFKSFEDTFDPASFFDFIENGRGARNTPVTALRPGIELSRPVAPVAASSDNRIEEFGANPVADMPAFPNLTFGPTDPRGLRNNNPGNIKKDDTAWVGLRPPELQLDPVFFQFLEMKFGIRAMARILKNYSRKHGINTLRGVSQRWAPTADGNDPVQHARNVLAHARNVISGIDQIISLTDSSILFGVVRGIMVAENGPKANFVSDETVIEGIEIESSG